MSTQGKRPPLTDATLRAIVGALQNQAEQPPPGFHPWQVWAKRWGVKRTSCIRYLSAGVKSGILESVLIRRDVGAYVRRMPFWGLTRKKARHGRKA